MQTKQSVTNSNDHQPSTACREKHAAMKLPIRSTVIAAFGLLSTLLPITQTAHAQNIPSREFAAPVVIQSAGSTADSIQSSVDAFRAALGNPNNGNNPGPLPSGRREINWDGGGPPVINGTPPVTPFLVFQNTRGATFTTPAGNGLTQAAATGGLLSLDTINPTYADLFAPFSPNRLVAPIGSNVTLGTFSIPGSGGAVAAGVQGFGAVFSDVDLAGDTTIEYFDVNGKSLGVFDVPAFTGNKTFSFLGITRSSNES